MWLRIIHWHSGWEEAGIRSLAEIWDGVTGDRKSAARGVIQDANQSLNCRQRAIIGGAKALYKWNQLIIDNILQIER